LSLYALGSGEKRWLVHLFSPDSRIYTQGDVIASLSTFDKGRSRAAGTATGALLCRTRLPTNAPRTSLESGPGPPPEAGNRAAVSSSPGVSPSSAPSARRARTRIHPRTRVPPDERSFPQILNRAFSRPFRCAKVEGSIPGPSGGPVDNQPLPLLATDDPQLLEDLLRLAAAASTEVDVARGADHALRLWAHTPLAVVGTDLSSALRNADPPPHRRLVIVCRAPADT